MPQSPAFGRPGPDTGWALRLLRFADYDRMAAGPHADDVLVALMSARASRLGRAPTKEDVEAALVLLGLQPDGLEAETLRVLADHRAAWLHAAAHEWSKGTAALEAIPTALLLETPIHLRTRLNQNPRLIGSGPLEGHPV